MASFSLWLAATLAWRSLSLPQTEEECSQQPAKARPAQALLQQTLNMTAVGTPPGLLIVPLQRRGSERSFYVGNITVGLPAQTLQVLFDTSSNGVILMHQKCRSKACLSHKRYSSLRSTSAEHIDYNGKQISKMALLGREPRDSASIEFTSADLPPGNVSGLLVRDRVCVQSQDDRRTCIPMAFLVALNLTDMPFSAMPNDGIVGLGPQMKDDPPMFSFGSRFLGRQGRLPIFGMSFGASGGELHIGGYHPAAIAAPLHWLPAHNPEMGYWQAEIFTVRIGNRTFDDCRRGCHAIIDTSASKLGVQKSNLRQLQEALVGNVGPELKCQGPSLEFDLGGMSITLEAADYMAADCTPDLGGLDVYESESPDFRGVFALGVTALRRYFIAFDWEQKSIGIAPAAGFSLRKPGDVQRITV
jgi:hypothetical protein